MRFRRIPVIGLIAFLLLAVLLTVGVLVVRSRAFHQYLLAKVVKYAQQEIGGRVELGDFTFQLWRLRADLYQIAVHGTERDAQAPLFAADHVAIDLRLLSL